VPRGRKTPPVVEVMPWWGDRGAAPHLRWPGVTIDIPCGWSPERERWESLDGRFYFDAATADKACDFFPAFLTHSQGEFANQPFELDDWQRCLIIRPLFGWKHVKTGLRRFRKLRLFIPKKNGKTQLAAGIALYLMFCDGEPGAQIVCAAADREQAKLIFDAGKSMVEDSQDLSEMADVYARSIVYGRSAMKVVSADVKTKHGPNISGLIFDEFHAQEKRDLYETLAKGVAARLQPIDAVTTTAGTNQESICYEEYDYAKKIMKGTNVDLTVLPVIFEAQGQRVEVFQSRESLERLDIMCTCECAPHILIVRRLMEIGVSLARTGRIDSRLATAISDAFTTLIDQCDVADCAGHATSNSCSIETRGISLGQSGNEPNGQPVTATGLGLLEAGGDRSQNPNSTWPSGRAVGSMGSQRTSTNRSKKRRAEGARFVSAKLSCASIIATLLGVFEDCSVPPATVGLVFSEIVQNVYEAHSPTCDVTKKVSIQRGQISVTHPPDDWTDLAVYARVNPGFGKTVKEDYILSEIAAAQSDPRKQNSLKNLHLNIWTQQETVWIPIEWWDACEVEEVGVREYENQAAGLDLSSKEDLTCFAITRSIKNRNAPALEVDLGHAEHDNDEDEGKEDAPRRTLNVDFDIEIIPFFWMPEGTLHDRVKKDRISYDVWRDLGLLRVTEGPIVDYDQMFEDITKEIAPKYGLAIDSRGARAPRDPKDHRGLQIGYDPWNAGQLPGALFDHGFLPVEVPQNVQRLSEPSKVLHALAKSGRAHHDGHRVLRYCVSNVSAKEDKKGNVFPYKTARNKRIDGALAAIDGLSRLIVLPPKKRSQSVYATRGVLTL
jgi:phage terminase large subunit-like protein